jgi:rfaE bifunctional protein kinase chain/domain
VDARAVSLQAAVGRLAGHRVLVVGDLVLDEYLTGRPARISREAPVMVLDVLDREERAGSAANPAANIVALGSHATVVGALGTDPPGERLAMRLQLLGMNSDGLVQVSGGETATKTRILAHGFTGGLHGLQQVLRLDRVPRYPQATAAECAERVSQLAPRHDAVLLSDYRAGVVEACTIEAALASGRPIAVDSQGDLRRFRGVDLVKINQAEAQAVLGADPLQGGEALRRQLELRYLVITLGAEGMVIFGGSDQPTRVAAVGASEVFDVTGAGDTVIAVLTLGLVAGLPVATAGALASAAASVVVRRLGVATVTPADLLAALSS